MKLNRLSMVVIAMLTTTLMANSDENKNGHLIEKIKALNISKAHKYVPTKVEDAGDLLFSKGYFDTPRGKKFATMFLTKDLKTAVYGRGFNTENVKEYKPYSVEEMKQNAGLVFGTGSDEYFLVVDPLCPYCMTFAEDLTQYEKDVKVYIIFMPLTNIHPTAPKAIAHILSQKDDKEKYKALSEISDGSIEFEKITKIDEKIQASMDKQILHASELGAKGTPSLFLSDGSQVKLEILRHKYKKDKTKEK